LRFELEREMGAKLNARWKKPMRGWASATPAGLPMPAMMAHEDQDHSQDGARALDIIEAINRAASNGRPVIPP
jgi:hypothetical protein